MGQELLIIEASRSHRDTQFMTEFLWTSDQRPLPDNIQHSQDNPVIRASGGIRS